MDYPIQCARTYVNPEGNIAASGYYRASTTQELANMMPPWMHMRENPRSVGQQLLSAPAVELKRLETTLNDLMKSKFISTAGVDEVDVLYRVKIPNNVNLTDPSASGVRCIAAPSGCSPSGVSQIWIKETSNLKEFYYDVLPTRIEVVSSGVYTPSVSDTSWHVKPSGILDLEEKYVDVWKVKHDISWCYKSNGSSLYTADVDVVQNTGTTHTDTAGVANPSYAYDNNWNTYSDWSQSHSGGSSTVAKTIVSQHDFSEDMPINRIDFKAYGSADTNDYDPPWYTMAYVLVEAKDDSNNWYVIYDSSGGYHSPNMTHPSTINTGVLSRTSFYSFYPGPTALLTTKIWRSVKISVVTYAASNHDQAIINRIYEIRAYVTYPGLAATPGGYFSKQDVETHEDYEIYPDAEADLGAYPYPGSLRTTWENGRISNSLLRGYGAALDMDYYRGILWWIGKESVGLASPKYYLNLSSTKTQIPNELNLDLLATFSLDNGFNLEPSGILIDEDGSINICDTNKSRTYKVMPRYDYFIMDKDNRYIYLKEDYRDSGVFISNT